MANNFIQPGNVLPLVAPYDVAAGAGFKVGQIFAVAAAAALNGKPVEGQRVGVFQLNKQTPEAWSQGALIYWDDTAKECTTTATGNLLIGAATEAVADSVAVGPVVLNAATRPNEA